MATAMEVDKTLEAHKEIAETITKEADAEIKAKTKAYDSLKNQKIECKNKIEKQTKAVDQDKKTLSTAKKLTDSLKKTCEIKQSQIKRLTEEVEQDTIIMEEQLHYNNALAYRLGMQQRKLDVETERLGELERKMGAVMVAPSFGSLELQQVDERIAAKVEELECPVCLKTCSPPIYTCPNQHLVCSTCRPQLTTCPVCRVVLGDELRVHRWAERDARELDQLRSDRFRMRVRLHGLMQIFVSNPWRKTLVLEVLPTDTMGRVKEMVEEKSGVHRGQHRLVSGWRRFEDDKTVEFYNIQNGSRIDMFEDEDEDEDDRFEDDKTMEFYNIQNGSRIDMF